MNWCWHFVELNSKQTLIWLTTKIELTTYLCANPNSWTACNTTSSVDFSSFKINVARRCKTRAMLYSNNWKWNIATWMKICINEISPKKWNQTLMRWNASKNYWIIQRTVSCGATRLAFSSVTLASFNLPARKYALAKYCITSTLLWR